MYTTGSAISRVTIHGQKGFLRSSLMTGMYHGPSRLVFSLFAAAHQTPVPFVSLDHGASFFGRDA
jgi:hypothetical protein